jgi:uncharacterized protein YqhQ
MTVDDDCHYIGGQAVIEGVMMRNGDVYGLAVRNPGGTIVARRLPWFSLTGVPLLNKPFLRGFPILLETLVNGIQALNRSAEISTEDAEDPLSTGQLLLAMAAAMLLAVGLFVAAPHLLSLIMLRLGLGGDLEGISFHLWDGFFKCCIFVIYIKLISCAKDVRRVFQYHGAEHKTIHAFESGGEITAALASKMSRLHPRCGTTFLLFVICISIILHTVVLPLLLALHTPQNALVKHALIIFVKLLLIVPISALAYELIRYAARLPEGLYAALLRAPGLMLQRLTTREPDRGQLDVALVALREALDEEDGASVRTAPYTTIG